MYRKRRDKELQQASFNTDYYNITKSKYLENKPMLPIYVSEANLNRTYKILNSLLFALEEMEGFTNVRLDSENDKGYFVIMKTTFYFIMMEEAKNKSKNDSEEHVPILVLSLSAGDEYYKCTNYSFKFKDKVDQPLEKQIGIIILEMLQTANKILIEEMLRDREYEREIKKKERQRRLEQMRKEELEEIRLLEQVVLDWNKSEEIRKFADQMELKIGEIEDKEKRHKLLLLASTFGEISANNFTEFFPVRFSHLIF